MPRERIPPSKVERGPSNEIVCSIVSVLYEIYSIMQMALGPETHEAWIDYSTTVLCNGHAAAYSIESPSGRYDSAASASKVERFEQDYLYGIKLAS